MSAAQRLINQGLKQGMHTAKMKIAENMLFQLVLGIDVVQQATGLSKEEIERLKNK